MSCQSAPNPPLQPWYTFLICVLLLHRAAPIFLFSVP
ncbi:unnamed protein product, partial [Staurois parvus]